MSTRLRRGWKVITTADRRSTISEVERLEPFSRHYPRRCRVYPLELCGPLAVFKTYNTALDFVLTNLKTRASSQWRSDPRHYRIVPCRYKRSSRQNLAAGSKVRSRQFLAYVETPVGTDFADFVTCLE